MKPGNEAAIIYQDWCRAFDSIDSADISAIQSAIVGMADMPLIHVLVITDDRHSRKTQLTIASLDAQIYRNFGIRMLAPVKLDDVGVLATLNADLKDSLAEAWLMVVFAGDVIAPHGLYWLAHEIAHHPNSVFIYADDDTINSHGIRVSPRFKPDWSLTHFHSTDFIGNAVILSAALIARSGGIDTALTHYGLYELLLRTLDASFCECRPVRHVPAVLLHRRESPQPAAAQTDWQRQALERHLSRRGATASVSTPLPGICRVSYGPAQPYPLVSIIIPTRDAPTLLRTCVESLIERTQYPRVEILVIDNQSRDSEALRYLASLSERNDKDWRFRVLRYNEPFNFSGMNNYAARHANGEMLCLLNNDTEVIASDWLEEMVGHLLQPGVGAVGAKLYYPDGRIQHAGDVIGRGGCANHLHSRLAHDDPGYCNRAVVAQELSAVTGACLLTPKYLFTQLGGLDSRNLAITFNDVDYCLRLREQGLKIVWTPYAELYHHESISRGGKKGWRKLLQAKLEAAYMRRRWKTEMLNDPFYNPNLCRKRPDFSLCQSPLIKRPWEQEC